MRIQQEGRQKRAEAEIELRLWEGDLKQKLLSIPGVRPAGYTSRMGGTCPLTNFPDTTVSLRGILTLKFGLR